MTGIKLEMICPFCGTTHYVRVEKSDYTKWVNGELAQKAFPYLDSMEREQIVSHICPICQEDTFDDDVE